jgi:methylmalonyl-CoA mutase cobalamin-binding subunit
MSRAEEIRAGLFEHTLKGRAPGVKAPSEEGPALGMDPMDIFFEALIPTGGPLLNRHRQGRHPRHREEPLSDHAGSAGFGVADLGVNAPPEKFVARGRAAQATHRRLLGLSDHRDADVQGQQALSKAGLRDKIHVAMGGTPVTEDYAKHFGADFYAPDASMATRMAKEVVGAKGDGSQGAAALEQAVKLIDETLRKG